MRMLKFCCLFGGRKYPLYLTGALAVFAAIGGLHLDFSPGVLHAAVLFTAFTSLLICWLIENIPSDEERKCIAEAQPPEWKPADKKMRDKVSERAKLPGRNVIIAAIACLIAVIFFLNVSDEGAGHALPLCAFLLGIGILLTDLIYRIRFRRLLDDSAVCAVIPVDRVYDIETKARRSWRFFDHNLVTYYSSYLVFYLPDGRYILPVPSTDHSFNAVALVRCRGMLRWTPVHQENNQITPV